MSLVESWQEVRELGLQRTLFRLSWEARVRSGFAGRPGPQPRKIGDLLRPGGSETDWTRRLPFADPRSVADAVGDRIPGERLAAMTRAARDAARGRILCFGRWTADFGDPIDWHLDPGSRQRWPRGPWTRALRDAERYSDVKLTWEAARFPHAYLMARAATLDRGNASDLAAALEAQIDAFVRSNPYATGVHWSSGQEVVVRLLAWLFALDTLLSRSGLARAAAALVGDALLAGATHVERHIDYARKAVYNNHLLAEALGLYAAGVLLPEAPAARRWRLLGRSILEEEAERQFYADGSYILQAFNYERSSLQYLMWAWALSRVAGEGAAEPWRRALERALAFLLAHQNPADGSLPNYGANDGSMPGIWSTCDFPDFRPALQTASILARGERLYEPGPWDEMPAWLVGPRCLDLPLRPPTRSSLSFGASGYYVLRGSDPGSFSTFRCGSMKDRFGQLDMLHVDVFWRGLDVLADGGSYLYGGPPAWHRHLSGTASHNTVTLDGRDQALPIRRFKFLHPTKAALLRFEDAAAHAIAAGEHYGYRRHAGGCVHRRCVLFVKHDLWVVVDTIAGSGRHAVRLHWLCGDFPCESDAAAGRLSLHTPRGDFGVAVFDGRGEPLRATVCRGGEAPPRGWISRHYGEKTPVASLAVEQDVECPVTLISVLGPGVPTLVPAPEASSLTAGAGEASAQFALREGLIEDVVAVGTAAP